MAKRLIGDKIAFIQVRKQQYEMLQKQVKSNCDFSSKKMKEYYDQKRIEPKHYQPGMIVYINHDVCVVGNKRKISINRRRATIVDRISDNAYIIRYENGRTVPCNIDRIYSLKRRSKDKELNSPPRKSENKIMKRKNSICVRINVQREIKNLKQKDSFTFSIFLCLTRIFH